MAVTPDTPQHIVEMREHVAALYEDERVPIESIRDYLREQLERHPEEPEVWFHLAGTFPDDPPAVAEHVARGLALAPDAPWVRVHAAEVLFEVAGDVAAATAHLKLAVETIDEDDHFLLLVALGLAARMNHREGRFDVAEKQVRLALEAEPDDPDYNALLAWVLVAKRKFHEARTVAGRAALKHPDDPDLYLLRTIRATDPMSATDIKLRRWPTPPAPSGGRPRGDP